MQAHPPSEAAQQARTRLQHTREALLRHMVHTEGAARARPGPAAGAAGSAPHGPAGDAHHSAYPDMDDAQAAGWSGPPPHPSPDGGPGDADGQGLGGLWQDLRDSASAWWQTHPAHLAVDVARPLFEKYARAHPLRVLAVAAATGAAVVMARPWRLISATGLLMAVVKSTQMTQLAASMLRPRDSEALRRHDTERAREAERQAWRQAQAEARARDAAR